MSISQIRQVALAFCFLLAISATLISMGDEWHKAIMLWGIIGTVLICRELIKE